MHAHKIGNTTRNRGIAGSIRTHLAHGSSRDGKLHAISRIPQLLSTIQTLQLPSPDTSAARHGAWQPWTQLPVRCCIAQLLVASFPQPGWRWPDRAGAERLAHTDTAFLHTESRPNPLASVTRFGAHRPVRERVSEPRGLEQRRARRDPEEWLVGAVERSLGVRSCPQSGRCARNLPLNPR